jgi:hypothetical protein
MKLRYTTNHDESAWEGTPVQFFGGTSGALSASAITIFLSAVPLLYDGQEVGRASLLPFFTRDPIQWSDHPEMVDIYEKFMDVYGESDAFKKGELKFFSNADAAIFTKTYNNDTYLIVVNVRNASTQVSLDASLQNTTWTDKLTDEAVSLSDSVAIPAYGYMILRKQL